MKLLRKNQPLRYCPRAALPKLLTPPHLRPLNTAQGQKILSAAARTLISASRVSPLKSATKFRGNRATAAKPPSYPRASGYIPTSACAPQGFSARGAIGGNICSRQFSDQIVRGPTLPPHRIAESNDGRNASRPTAPMTDVWAKLNFPTIARARAKNISFTYS